MMWHIESSFSRGGKAASIHKNNGQSESLADSDQKADDKSVKALLETFSKNRPHALVIDDKYAWFPYDLASKGCTYAVLGWYRIANVWGKSGSQMGWSIWKSAHDHVMQPRSSSQQVQRSTSSDTSSPSNGVTNRANHGGSLDPIPTQQRLVGSFFPFSETS